MLFPKHPIKHLSERLRPRLDFLPDLHSDQPNRNLQLRLIRQHRLDSLKELPDDPGQDAASRQLTGGAVD